LNPPTDVSGKEYIDGISALEAMVVGHGREELVDAAANQMRALAFLDVFRYLSVPAIELAETLVRLTPEPLSSVFFTPGGAEAVEVAIKLARQYHRICGEPSRQKVLTRAGAFHGCTFGAMEVDGNYWATKNHIYESGPTAGRIVPPSACTRCDLGKAGRYLACPHQIEAAILAERPETIAAVVVDPAATAIAVAVPPPQYLRDLRAICDKHGVLLVVDEIITGFGRTGTLFCCERSGVAPDILTLSKGLTSGYAALGAAVVSGTVADAFQDVPEGVFAHGHTYGGHPVACAVALANLAIIEREGLVERSKAAGEHLLECLWHALEPCNTVWDVRGLGLLAGVDLTRTRDGDAFETPSSVGIRVRLKCRENGLITLPLHPGNVMFLAPPLVITDKEIEQMCATFARSVLEVERDLSLA
jgi:adenosylmethionine-8-amino-7-oxononanoate aminotransferase